MTAAAGSDTGRAALRRTALMCASYQNYPDVVRELLKAGADPTYEYAGTTSRDLAEQQGNREIVKILDASSKH